MINRQQDLVHQSMFENVPIILALRSFEKPLIIPVAMPG